MFGKCIICIYVILYKYSHIGTTVVFYNAMYPHPHGLIGLIFYANH